MFRPSSRTHLGFLTILVLSAAAAAAASGSPPVAAEVRPGQALLYLIRPHGAVGGNSIDMTVFANEEPIAGIEADAYGTAHLDPGRYVIWIHTGLSRVLELVPGQTYYVHCALDTGVTLLSEAEGKELMAKAPNFMSLTPEKTAKQKQKAAQWFPKVKPTDYVWVPPAPPVPPPADTSGLLRVAAYSPVELELMEIVSSAYTKGGSRVWFRVRTDTAVEGGVWLRAGTPVPGTLQLGQKGAGGGTGGVLEIDIPEVPAASGAAIPVVGQVLSAGTSRTKGATAAFAFGGFLGAQAVKGREAFHLPGDVVTVFTRAESWTPPAAELPQAAPPASGPLALAAALAAPIEFTPDRAKPLALVTVTLDTAETVADLSLAEVDGWQLPTPAAALNGRSAEGRWRATFSGWDVVRHLPASDDPVPVRFTGHLADGRELVATGTLGWTPPKEK